MIGSLSSTKIKVSDAMEGQFGIIQETVPLVEGINLMTKNGWDIMIVTNSTNQIVGIITKKRLLQASAKNNLNTPVGKVCRREVITTSPDMDLTTARNIMQQYNIGYLPVLDPTGRLIGLLTAKGICNAFSLKIESLGKQLSTIVENIAEAIQVIDSSGTVLLWNKSAEKMFGIKAENVIGKRLADFLNDELLLEVMSTLQPRYNILSQLDNGLYVLRNAVPIMTSDNRLFGVVCSSLDITHIKTLLEKSEQSYSTITIVSHKKGRYRKKEITNQQLFYTIDPATRQVLEQAIRVSTTDATVLILGESGTGKSLLAKTIHWHSKRSQNPFVEINCSAIPEALFESEMFGYEPGTFTGGSRLGKPGKFEIANNGTIFLDEIGLLPLNVQAKLLHVLEERQFYRLGGHTPVKVNIRLIAATNSDLGEMVLNNKFREDLYYRLNVVTLKIPPLRERKKDVPGLVEKFVKELGRTYNRTIKCIDDEVIELFMNYSWPGNVRELRNLVERIILLSASDYITIASLQEAGVWELLNKKQSGLNATKKPLSNKKLKEFLSNNEREIILEALQSCNFNIAKTARSLGISRSTLYYKINSLGINLGKSRH